MLRQVYADKKHLLILRCGAQSIHRAWVNRAREIVDIAYVYYDDSDFSSENPDYSGFFPGTKLQGAYDFLIENEDIIEKYDYFWIIEDDLFIPHETIGGIVGFVNKYDIKLCAPSLSSDSYFSHSIMVRNTNLLLRGTDFVECMAPIMSRDFLLRSLENFREFPVWGIERFWQSLLWDMQEVAFIFDKWPICHTRPIRSGSLYNVAEQMNIDLQADEEKAKERYSEKFNRYINIFFGIQDRFDAPLLSGSALRRVMAAGLTYDLKNNHAFALDDVLKRTNFTNELFSQFLTFPTVRNILRTPAVLPEESNFMVRDWSIGSVKDEVVWSKELKLDFNGKIQGACSDNEYLWSLENHILILFSQDGRITSRFMDKRIVDGKIILFGVGEDKTVRFLREN